MGSASAIREGAYNYYVYCRAQPRGSGHWMRYYRTIYLCLPLSQNGRRSPEFRWLINNNNNNNNNNSGLKNALVSHNFSLFTTSLKMRVMISRVRTKSQRTSEQAIFGQTNKQTNRGGEGNVRNKIAENWHVVCACDHTKMRDDLQSVDEIPANKWTINSWANKQTNKQGWWRKCKE